MKIKKEFEEDVEKKDKVEQLDFKKVDYNFIFLQFQY